MIGGSGEKKTLPGDETTVQHDGAADAEEAAHLKRQLDHGSVGTRF